jgi:hypothetical protein
MTFNNRGGEPVPLPNLDPAFRQAQSQHWGQARVLLGRHQKSRDCMGVLNTRVYSGVVRLL